MASPTRLATTLSVHNPCNRILFRLATHSLVTVSSAWYASFSRSFCLLAFLVPIMAPLLRRGTLRKLVVVSTVS